MDIQNLNRDENGGLMGTVQIGEAESYIHLFPIDRESDCQDVRSECTQNPYWLDFLRLTEGMDGPLQTIRVLGYGDDFLFYIVPKPNT